MSEDPRRLGEEIVARCRELGFALAGVTGAGPTDHRAELEAWLGAGKHGSMEWMGRNEEVRADVGAFLPGARSVIMVADQHGERGEGEREPDEGTDRERAGGRGKIARYARGEDYHRVMKRRLHALADDLRERYPGEAFRSFVDTAPVMEREHAMRAGLGWIGKHTLLIHPRRGSWLLLGGIVTTMELEPPRDQRRSPDHCGTCTRCIDACPTDAITPYAVDATRCISYLTIERRGMIDERFHAAISDWMFGCDICQEVCPHNSARDGDIPTGRANEAYAARLDSFDLLEVLGWTDADRRAAFAGSALKRAKLGMMKRNALIVAGNQVARGEAPGLRARIEAIARDEGEDELVRETARAVAGRLRGIGER